MSVFFVVRLGVVATAESVLSLRFRDGCEGVYSLSLSSVPAEWGVDAGTEDGPAG